MDENWADSSRDIYNRLYREGYPNGFAQTLVHTFNYPLHLRICDLGCGNAALAQDFENYVGMDVSDVAVNRAQIIHPQKTFLRASLDRLPELLRVCEFDLAVCCDVMEHVPTDAIPNVLEQFTKLNTPKIAFGISCRDSQYKDHNGDSLHLTVWEPSKWMDTLNKFFRVNRMIYDSTMLMVETINEA